MAWLPVSEWFWTTALAAVPLTLLVAVANRWLVRRPATRHALWLCVLVWFAASPTLMLAAPLTRSLWTRLWSGGDGAAHAGRRAPVSPRTGVVSPATAGIRREGTAAIDALPGSEPALRPFVRVRPAGKGAVGPTADRGLAPIDSTVAFVTRETALGPLTRDSGASLPAPRPPTATGGEARPVRSPPTARLASDEPGSARASDVPSAAVAAPPSTAAPLRGWLKALTGAVAPAAIGLARLRDALLEFPALPARVWLTGTGLLTVGLLVRAARFRFRLRRARPAPLRFRRAVRRLAASMGLRDAPETLVIDAPVPPMVWCGRRPRLIIPTRLWRQLDAVGRQAVVCHELAHLRRADHAVRWLALGVGAGFWWHPLAWWVRARLDEEAELACDAWVTWLLPHGRRAYAEALLKARASVQFGPDAVPAAGIGVFSPRARRFARRLTMVMTHEPRPRLSAAGALLATIAVTIGWVSAPVLACPEKERAAKAARPAERAVAGVAACTTLAPCEPGALPAVPSAPLAPTGATYRGVSPVPSVPGAAFHGATTPATARSLLGARMMLAPAAPAAATCPPDAPPVSTAARAALVAPAPVAVYGAVTPDGTSFQRYVAAYPSADGGATTPAAAVTFGARGGDDDLRASLARLEAELAELRARIDAQARSDDATSWVEFARQRQPDAAPALPYILAQRAQAADEEVKASRAAQEREQARIAVGDVIIKQYAVPPGKLEALTALMVRDDVPVRVRQVGDKIEVHATARQHEVFRNFVDILTPEEQSRAFRIKGGKLEALWELMKRDDVPVLVEQTAGGIRAHGTPVVLRALADFVELIGGDSERAAAPAGPGPEAVSAGKAVRNLALGRVMQPVPTNDAASARLSTLGYIAAGQVASRRAALQKQMDALRARSEQLMRAAEKLQKEAAKMEKQAERLRERSDAIRSKASEAETDQERQRAEERAAASEAQAVDVEARMQQLQAEAEAIEAQAEAIEAESEQLEAAAQALEASADGEPPDADPVEPEFVVPEPAESINPISAEEPAAVARP